MNCSCAAAASDPRWPPGAQRVPGDAGDADTFVAYGLQVGKRFQNALP
jgi:hypothetical protein